MRSLPAGAAGLEDIARLLMMHPRAVQRELAGTGTTFEAMVDDARRDLTTTLLANRDVSLSAVARQIGYSEQSTLTRSCHRWFKMSALAKRRETDRSERGDVRNRSRSDDASACFGAHLPGLARGPPTMAHQHDTHRSSGEGGAAPQCRGRAVGAVDQWTGGERAENGTDIECGGRQGTGDTRSSRCGGLHDRRDQRRTAAQPTGRAATVWMPPENSPRHLNNPPPSHRSDDYNVMTRPLRMMFRPAAIRYRRAGMSCAA